MMQQWQQMMWQQQQLQQQSQQSVPSSSPQHQSLTTTSTAAPNSQPLSPAMAPPTFPDPQQFNFWLHAQQQLGMPVEQLQWWWQQMQQFVMLQQQQQQLQRLEQAQGGLVRNSSVPHDMSAWMDSLPLPADGRFCAQASDILSKSHSARHRVY
jgi:hypothetical protein